MVFKYKVATQNGEVIEGIYEADSAEVVSEMLKSKNYYVISLQKTRSIKLETAFKPKVKTKDIAVFCRQFHAMLKAGINLVTCLDIMRTQLTNKTLKEAVGDMYEDIQKGLNLSAAMMKHSDVFPSLLISMIEAGEVSGNLDEMMERMAEFYEKESSLERKIKGAMVYPIILMVVTVAVVIFLVTSVMPTFITVFEDSDTPLPAPTQLLLKLSASLTSYWYIYIAVIVLLILFIRSWGKTDKGRLFIDNLKLKIPVFGPTNVQIITSRFTRTFATLLSSGISLVEAFDAVIRIVGNKVVEEKLEEAKDKVIKGTPLSLAIKATGIFPPMLDSMLRVGEESGALDDALQRTADYYDDEVDYAVEKMTTAFEPILIVFMGVVVGFVVIAMMMPMFDMIGAVQ